MNVIEEKKPRRQRADGIRSRQVILTAAARLATIEGLEGLSIGRLAEHIGMSKSGLYAHFGSKEELQLATIDTAAEIFATDVVQPAEAIADPLARVEALCERFLSHLERRVFPGGCFFISAAAEFDTHPGAVKERLADYQRSWLSMLEQLIEQAKERGEINPSEDAAQLAFEIDAFLLMANAVFVLQSDVAPLRHARQAVESRLALSRRAGP
jgi:AcrR family transcriptional regulator